MKIRPTSHGRLPAPPPRAQIRLLRRIFREPAPVLDELRSGYGPVCGLGAGPVRLAILGDASSVRQVLAMPTSTFRWGHKFNVLGFVVGSSSMIVSDGDEHRRRRSSVQAAFSRRRLNRWIPMILERTDTTVERILADDRRDLGAVDLYPVGRHLVLEVVLLALFGERLAGRVDEIEELFRRSQAYLEAPAVRQLPHPLPFTARARVRADRRRLDALIDTEIADRRTRQEADPLDVLDVLARDGSLTDGEIRDQVVTLIGAGHDTTAASLAWILWCATLAGDTWARLGAEADEVLGPVGSPDHGPDDTTLAQLDLAGRVVRETLRLHPAGVVSPREAAEDLDIAGFRIPRGTLLLWSAHLVGRDPAAWPDPLRFDPDRFTDLTPEQRRLTEQSWVPFGGGPRNCLGFALAQMELTLIVARLAQRLVLTPTDEVPPRPVGMVVNRPETGVPMHVTSRSPRR